MRHYTELKQRVQSLAETESLSLLLSQARIPLKIFQEYLYARIATVRVQKEDSWTEGNAP